MYMYSTNMENIFFIFYNKCKGHTGLAIDCLIVCATPPSMVCNERVMSFTLNGYTFVAQRVNSSIGIEECMTQSIT